MPKVSASKIYKMFRNLRIAILLFPLLTMVDSVEKLIVESGNFIVVLTVMILTYLGH